MRKLLNIPELASQHGGDVDKLIIYLHLLMIALFVGWLLYFAYALWRFRARTSPKADHLGVTNNASNWIEGAVALVEMVLLFGLAIPLWAKVVDEFPPEKDSTVLHIIASQFNWMGRYPGPDAQFGKQDMKLLSAENALGVDPSDAHSKDDFTTGRDDIRVPVNKPVIAKVTSMDVIHSFKIIALRVCQDATPGMIVPVHFIPNKTGAYVINCAQLCGVGHTTMKGTLHVVSQEDYDKWAKTKGPAVSYE
jgi:cytochrome c oxidase subunit 2